jgi:hypothetical protein
MKDRKAFNFFRSYFDIYNELENVEDKVSFMDALLKKQFLNQEPNQLKGMAKFAYVSQKYSIDKQVKGYFDKVEAIKNNDPKQGPKVDPRQGGAQGPKVDPRQQEKGQEKEKVKYIDPIQKVLIESDNSKHEPLIKTSYKNFMNVLSKECPTLSKIPKQLNIDTYYQLVNEYGKDKLGLELEKMDLWIEEKGVKRKDVNASIKRWLKNGY